MSHRALTKFLHSSLFLATCAASPQLLQPNWFCFFSTILLYVSLGLPRCLLTGGCHVSNILFLPVLFSPQNMSNPLPSFVSIEIHYSSFTTVFKMVDYPRRLFMTSWFTARYYFSLHNILGSPSILFYTLRYATLRENPNFDKSIIFVSVLSEREKKSRYIYIYI